MKEASAVGVASGKVILLGEHSVVYGEPAIAAAIDRQLEVTVRPRSGGNPYGAIGNRQRLAIARAAQRFGIEPETLMVEVRSEIPMGCGLGSSAAFSLALIRALSLFSRKPLLDGEVASRAAEIENVFHGTASGVDLAAAVQGGVIWFERFSAAPIVELLPPEPLDLVIALSGKPRGTFGPVSRLRDRYERFPKLYGRMFRLTGDVVRSARIALAAGDLELLGSLMNAAHGLLNALGVSTPTIDRMVRLARSAGAVGAKLTGAGGGGAVIALAPRGAEAVVSALAEEGFESFVTRLSVREPKGSQ